MQRADPAQARPKSPSARDTLWWTLGLVAVAAIGAIVRLVGWDCVFTPGGVRFVVDTDPNYHVLQAQRLLEHGSPWFDRMLNWPFGADVPWPPLFDVLIAGAARVVFGSAPSFAQTERAAAIVPVLLGVATLPLVAALATALLGRGRGLGAALIVALLMSHVSFSTVGRPDQHVAEVLLSCGIALAFVKAFTATRRDAWCVAVAALGAAVALSFWNWMGSAFNLVLPVGFAALGHVVLDRPSSRRVSSALAAALAVATALLLVSVAAWGAPGALRHGDLSGITGAHVALTGCAAATGALLVVASRMSARPAGPVRRLGEAVLACALPAAATLAAVPPLREGVRQGLTALGAGNPWYADIGEFQHLLFSCDLPLADELVGILSVYGLAPVAAALSVTALVDRWRRSRSSAPAVLFLGCWALGYLVLALLRRRFAAYFTIPLAILAFEGAIVVARSVASRLWPARTWTAAAGAVVGALVIVAPSIRLVGDGAPRQPEEHLRALRWLSSQPPVDGNEGVLAPWALGHLVLYYGRKPVIVSPFGTEGGPRSMEFAAAIDLASDPSEAERLLWSRRVGWVVLGNPLHHVSVDQGFGPPGTPAMVVRTCSITVGASESVTEEYASALAPRLYFFDGMTAPGRSGPPAPGFRLVYETPGKEAEPLKIFQHVPGALLSASGTRAAARVQAIVHVRTNQGRTFVWSVTADADARGVARLRVPYATGANGTVLAGECRLSDGADTKQVTISSEDVIRGRELVVALEPGPGERRRASAAVPGPEDR